VGKTDKLGLVVTMYNVSGESATRYKPLPPHTYRVLCTTYYAAAAVGIIIVIIVFERLACSILSRHSL
jgi:hypothetical protein